jgi:hypothetical protein
VPSTGPVADPVINAPTTTRNTRIASCAFSVCANGSMRRVPCIAAQATTRGVSSSGESAIHAAHTPMWRSLSPDQSAATVGNVAKPSTHRITPYRALALKSQASHAQAFSRWPREFAAATWLTVACTRPWFTRNHRSE